MVKSSEKKMEAREVGAEEGLEVKLEWDLKVGIVLL